MKLTVKTLNYHETSPYSRFSFIVGLEDINEITEIFDWGDKVNPPLTDFLPLDDEFYSVVEENLIGEEWDKRSVVGVFYPILVRGAEIGKTYRGRYYFLFPSKIFCYLAGTVAVKDVFDLNIIKSKDLEGVVSDFPVNNTTFLYGFGRPPELYEIDLHFYSLKTPYTKRDVVSKYGEKLLSSL